MTPRRVLTLVALAAGLAAAPTVVRKGFLHLTGTVVRDERRPR